MNLGVGGPKKDEKGQYTYRKKIINELITFYCVLLHLLGPKGCSGDGEQDQPSLSRLISIQTPQRNLPSTANLRQGYGYGEG